MEEGIRRDLVALTVSTFLQIWDGCGMGVNDFYVFCSESPPVNRAGWAGPDLRLGLVEVREGRMEDEMGSAIVPHTAGTFLCSVNQPLGLNHPKLHGPATVKGREGKGIEGSVESNQASQNMHILAYGSMWALTFRVFLSMYYPSFEGSARDTTILRDREEKSFREHNK
ncbi:hypothetical protein LY76DRAFT_83779 [Colletotrichum caudatum]|nr:hypothetical protein LY76DRAFT_83779 [Colletotrichum caudatum]